MITPSFPSSLGKKWLIDPDVCQRLTLDPPGSIQLQLITNIEAFGFMFNFWFLFLCLFLAPSPSPPGAPETEADDDIIEGASSGHQAFPGPVTDKGMAGSAL